MTVTADVRCPSLLRLLTHFPAAPRLSINMPELDEEELACLAEARGFASGVTELHISEPSGVQPGFLTPGLWEALPGLRKLQFEEGLEPYVRVPVPELVRCFAAAPHPVTVEGLEAEGEEAQEQLQAQVVALPGGRINLLQCC